MKIILTERQFNLYKEWLLNEEVTFRPTVEWMQTKFNELNSSCFNGELPMCKMEVRKLPKNVLGRFCLNVPKSTILKHQTSTNKIIRCENIAGVLFKFYLDKQYIDESCNPSISLTTVVGMNERDWTATLIHEMCHYYNYYAQGMSDVVNKGHGQVFHSACEMAASNGGNDYTVKDIETSENSTIETDEQYINGELGKNQDKTLGYIVFVDYLYKGQTVTMMFVTKNYGLIKELYQEAQNNEYYSKVSYIENNKLFIELSSKLKVVSKAFVGRSGQFNNSQNSLSDYGGKLINTILTDYSSEIKVVLDKANNQDNGINNDVIVQKERKLPKLVVMVFKRRGEVGKIYRMDENTLYLISTEKGAQKIMNEIYSSPSLQKIVEYGWICQEQKLAYELYNQGVKKSTSYLKNRYRIDSNDRQLFFMYANKFSQVYGEEADMEDWI